MVIIIRKLGSLQDPQVFRPWTFRIASREAFRRGVYLTPPIASRRSAIACDDNTFSISSGLFFMSSSLNSRMNRPALVNS